MRLRQVGLGTARSLNEILAGAVMVGHVLGRYWAGILIKFSNETYMKVL